MMLKSMHLTLTTKEGRGGVVVEVVAWRFRVRVRGLVKGRGVRES